MEIGVPDRADSLSDSSILYIVILHVPAVPLAPRSLTLPPLISAVNVASGDASALEIIVLYSFMNASEPSCTSKISVDSTSFVVVLFIDMKYFAPLKEEAENVSMLAAAESKSATSKVCCCVKVELPACVPEESLSPRPILKKCSVLIAELVEPSANFPPAPSNLTLSDAVLMSEDSCTSSAAEVLIICDEPENESKVDPSSVPRASMCFCI